MPGCKSRSQIEGIETTRPPCRRRGRSYVAKADPRLRGLKPDHERTLCLDPEGRVAKADPRLRGLKLRQYALLSQSFENGCKSRSQIEGIETF